MARCFIAIDIPEKVKNEIARIQQRLPEFKGKQTESKNLHLTLKFLGEISEEKIEAVKTKLREVNFLKFNAELDSLGVFSPKFVKIVWLCLKNCKELQKEIDEKLADLFPKENRFMSHLTIARVKNLKDKKDFLAKIEEMEIPHISFEVKGFKLKKSVLKKSGPDYETLEEFELN